MKRLKKIWGAVVKTYNKVWPFFFHPLKPNMPDAERIGAILRHLVTAWLLLLIVMFGGALIIQKTRPSCIPEESCRVLMKAAEDQ